MEGFEASRRGGTSYDVEEKTFEVASEIICLDCFGSNKLRVLTCGRANGGGYSLSGSD